MTRHRGRIAAVTLMVIAPLSLAGCAVDNEELSRSDSQLVFDDIRSLRGDEMTMHGLEPTSLVQALPNREYWFIDDRGLRRDLSFSRTLVIGTVTRVDRGPAYRHDGEDVLTRVDFDDPSAAERTVDITVSVEEEFGRNGASASSPGELAFRWGGLGSMNPTERDEYMASLRALGQVVVVLTTRDDPDGQVFIPILQGGLLGQVTDAGELRFPGLGADEAEFIGTIQTVSDIRTAAGKSHRVLEWNPIAK
jgi:hypothetical protein